VRLMKCSRCSRVLYQRANGIAAGEMCGKEIPAEWFPQGDVSYHLTHCPGILEPLGTLTPQS
jgi:hypothetical protein